MANVGLCHGAWCPDTSKEGRQITLRWAKSGCHGTPFYYFLFYLFAFFLSNSFYISRFSFFSLHHLNDKFDSEYQYVDVDDQVHKTSKRIDPLKSFRTWSASPHGPQGASNRVRSSVRSSFPAVNRHMWSPKGMSAHDRTLTCNYRLVSLWDAWIYGSSRWMLINSFGQAACL